MVRPLFVSLLVLPMFAMPLAGQTTLPATRQATTLEATALEATTQPTTQPMDLSTPRGAVKVFWSAYGLRDGKALKRVVFGSNAAQNHMIAAQAQKWEADGQMVDAMQAKFPGEIKVDIRKRAREQVAAALLNIDEATETINGDTATVQAKGATGNGVTLKRIDGEWRIPLDVIVQPTDQDKMETNAHDVEIQARVVMAGVNDVNAGKYQSLTDAESDIRQRLLTANLEDHAARIKATTQPTTEPATQP